ncbi:MAG: UbiA family prenyltransferase, partial [Gemmatimonadetes bacterium]|nr:UbiA family prenyltransferase [Gemmatimonadota bacterium]
MMRPWFTLVRFPNLVILTVALLFAWFHAGGEAKAAVILPAILAAISIVAAFYIENDRRDRAVDAVSAPSRPLVTGAVPENAARGAELVLFAAGWGAAWFAGPLVLGFAAFWTVSLAL